MPAIDRKAEEIESHFGDMNQIFEDFLDKMRTRSEEIQNALEEVPELLLDQVDWGEGVNIFAHRKISSVPLDEGIRYGRKA
jgi:hypothetical protein